MRIRTRLEGTSALLLHNIQLADPDNKWAKQISAITKKRTKTEEDRQEIGRLEWQGSLYLEDGRIVVPTSNVRRCFQEAAKVTRQGKQIGRGLNQAEQLFALLVFPDQDTPVNQLMNNPNYRDATLVAIKGSRNVRIRPFFRVWGLSCEWILLPEVLDLDQLRVIADLAGKIEGLGDNRTNGFGRFNVTVEEIG